MPTPQRRTAAPAPAVYGMLGDHSFYSGGGVSLPDGDYRWEDVQVVMFTPTKRDGTASGKNPFLSVQVTLTPPNGAATEEERHVQQYSMGSQAHLSWMPDPETGTRIIPVPNGPASGLNNQTNWEMLRKSLYDAMMPEGILTDDLSVLNGILTHMSNVPEPEERKGFAAAKTGEASAEPRQDRKVLVVQEIMEASWIQAAPAARTAARPAARAAAPAAAAPPARAAAPPARRAPAPPPPPAAAEEQSDDAFIEDTITAVLSIPANSGGMAKLKLRSACFKALTDSVGPEECQRLMDLFWSDDETISAVYNRLGYSIKGANVSPN